MDSRSTQQKGRAPDSSSCSSSPTFEQDRSSSSRPPSWNNFVEGFRRDPKAHIFNRSVQAHGGRGTSYDDDAAAHATAASPLAKQLKGRHLQMLAIGGSVGTGLFVGSGESLATGGPASVLVAFSLLGISLYCTVHALGEMAVTFPVSGSFSAFSTRFIDPAWGFAMGWNYSLQWIISLPLEMIAATYTIQYWDYSINPDAFVILFLGFIAFLNVFGVRGYGESEFVMSAIKFTAIIGFIVLGIVLVAGGGSPGDYYIGARYWHSPGAFANGFRGFCSVFTNAAFAFAGTELVGLAAAESEKPHKSIPRAVKQVFWRITIFYIVSLLLVGLLVPHNDARLLDGSNKVDANVSPFVIAIERSAISVMPSVFNAVILIAVLSVGNAAVYASSRTLAALAEQGQAPIWLAYIDRRGRPLVAIGLALLVGLLAFFAGSRYQGAAFDWMIALSGLSEIFTWGSICLCHIRFRRAWLLQGHSLDELPYRSQPGVMGSWIGLGVNALILIAQFWTGFAPVGYQHLSTAQRTTSWFQAYLAAPLVIVSYLGYKFWFRTRIMRSHTMDLRTGRRQLDLSEVIALESMEQRKWSRPKRIYHFFC